MQNTYQDLITDIQSKNPEIKGKLEGGKKFKLVTDFKPAGDQPEAIKKLVNNANKGEFSINHFVFFEIAFFSLLGVILKLSVSLHFTIFGFPPANKTISG